MSSIYRLIGEEKGRFAPLPFFCVGSPPLKVLNEYILSRKEVFVNAKIPRYLAHKARVQARAVCDYTI